MKKIFLALLLMPLAAFGQPFLVCDDYLAPATGQNDTRPTSFTITFSSPTTQAPITSAAITDPTGTTGSVYLHADLSVLANGNYTCTVTATNSAGTSAPSSPFTFTLPIIVTPGVPAHVRVTPQ